MGFGIKKTKIEDQLLTDMFLVIKSGIKGWDMPYCSPSCRGK